MRYILDDNGYIDSVSCTPFNCKDKSCTEYTGEIPSGYESIAEWAQNANIRAYKVVEGNLTLDEVKAAELEAEWATEWKTATLSSTFKAYNNEAKNMPEYKRIGDIVEIRGVVTPASDIASGGSGTIFTLPEGHRPHKEVYAICQGTSRNVWLLTVYTSGEVVFSRYGAASYDKAVNGTWLPFNVTFMVGGAI